MKRRQQVPRTLMSLRHIPSLSEIELSDGRFCGSAHASPSPISLEIRRFFETDSQRWRKRLRLWPLPQIRKHGDASAEIFVWIHAAITTIKVTSGGKSINFLPEKKTARPAGFAPGSSRCVAVSSTDTGPAPDWHSVRGFDSSHVPENAKSRLLISITIMASTTSSADRIEIPRGSIAGFFCTDGKSTYWKLRRRGSFRLSRIIPFAAAARALSRDNVVEGRSHCGGRGKPAAPLPAGGCGQNRLLGGRLLNQEAIC